MGEDLENRNMTPETGFINKNFILKNELSMKFGYESLHSMFDEFNGIEFNKQEEVFIASVKVIIKRKFNERLEELKNEMRK